MKKLPFFVAAALLLAGAGCADRVAEQAVTPITVPIAALNQSKEAIAQAQARANQDADALSDRATVAFTLTEMAEVPKNAEVGETFGCNDRIVLTTVPRTAETADVLHDALTSLFAIRDTSYKGFYNALAFSSLKVDEILSRDGVVTEVWLKGKVQSGGVCDDPRIKAQIENTVKRLRPKYKIFLNGTESAYRCLGDLKGDCK